MTPKELFMETLKPDGRPERQIKQYEATQVIFTDPVTSFLRGNRVRGSVTKDRWGVTILFPENAPGAMPHITEETKVLPDITRWREYVQAPDLEANCSDGWEPARQAAEEVRARGCMPTTLMGTGIFEQCHFLMGFEDTLTNLYEHPKEMHELIDYILQYRLTQARLVIENLHPDAILSHDDWGTKDALFMQEDMWREFFKEPYREFYSYIRSQDVVAIHHADSYLRPIIHDMAELGIQVWQGILPENDIPAVQAELAGKMTVMGGIGAAIDRDDATEEEIEAYVKNTLETCCPGGHFIPCITYGAPGAVYPQVDPVINRCIDEYNQILHMPSFRPPVPARRVRSARAATADRAAETASHQQGILEKISLATQRGQKKRVLQFCQTALDDGYAAADILQSGLLSGMEKVGEDFSANRVFVPEMLLAARCMSAATDFLKPHLVGDASGGAGRVVLGTCKGDMHDIGKNLVKIMMEGSGLEVFDLGVDVPAERFVEEAIDKDCDIIACSALLTTSMPEMRRVVQLIRDSEVGRKVKIMVGGAPLNQSYCEEIGADIYTVDAAEAAREAVRAIAAL